MKRAGLIILGIGAVALVAVLGLAWYLLDRMTKEENAQRIAPALANRWKKKEEPQPETPPASEGEPGEPVKPV